MKNTRSSSFDRNIESEKAEQMQKQVEEEERVKKDAQISDMIAECLFRQVTHEAVHVAALRPFNGLVSKLLEQTDTLFKKMFSE